MVIITLTLSYINEEGRSNSKLCNARRLSLFFVLLQRFSDAARLNLLELLGDAVPALLVRSSIDPVRNQVTGEYSQSLHFKWTGKVSTS